MFMNPRKVAKMMGRPTNQNLQVAVLRASMKGSTGDQTIQDGDLSWTPKAALFLYNRGSTNGTITDHMRGSIGAADGTNQWCAAWDARDNQTTMDTARIGTTDEVIQKISITSNAIESEANFKAWVTGGVTITWGVASASTEPLIIILFGGDDASFKVGTFARPAAAATHEEDVGFQPQALIMAGPNRQMNDAFSASAAIGWGFASYDGSTISQCGHFYFSSGGVATSELHCSVGNDAIFASYSIPLSVTAVGATSFTVTATGSSTQDLGYLAIGNINNAKADILDSPTSTGVQSLTAPFEPKLGLIIPNTSTDEARTELTNGAAGGFGFSAFTADYEESMGWSDLDGSGTSDTKNVVNNKAIHYTDHGGTLHYSGTFSAFTATSADINFTTANGTSRKWPSLFIS